MHKASVRELKEGDVLAEPVVSHHGMAILNKGATLTARYIKRLQEMGVRTVTIEGSPAEKPRAVRPAIKPATEPKQWILEELFGKLEREADYVLAVDERTRSQLKRRYRNAVIDLTCEPQIVELLARLRRSDRQLFDRSVKVSILSAMLGIASQYDSGKMTEFVIGSLLYDIGMTAEPGMLAELPESPGASGSVRGRGRRGFDRVKLHPVEGYYMLRRIDGMPELSAQCALLHHERYNGSGYPYKLAGSRIPDYAQIIGMCDAYCSLLSPEAEGLPYRAEEAVEYLYAAGNYTFDAELVRLFLRHVAAYPVTSVIKLSSGQTGIVQSYSSKLLHRPVVRIIEEADGLGVAAPYELDLASSKTITVLQAAGPLHR